MAISLHRPSPQIPRPSSRSALICYDSAVYIINLSNQQVKKSAVDITWVFVLTLNMSLNVLLWAVSYREVRDAHSKDDVEEIINVALDVIDQCSERWPGTKNASQLYSIFGRACLQSFDTNDDPSNSSGTSAFTSPLMMDNDSPAASDNSLTTTVSNGSSFTQNQQRPVFTQPVFGYTVDSAEDMNAFSFEPNPFQQPTFRSNSIFRNPSSEPPEGRRPSYGYFPPDFKHPSSGDPHSGESKPPVRGNPHSAQSPSMGAPHDQMPTPPESMSTTSSSFSPPMTSYSSTTGSPTPKMTYASPMPVNMNQQQTVPPAHMKYEPAPDNMKYEPPSTPNTQPTPQRTPQQPSQRTPTFAVPPLPQHIVNSQRQPPSQQRPLPQHNPANDWFSTPPPYISSYPYNDMGSANGFWNDAAASNAAFGGIMGGGGYEGTSPTSIGGFGGRPGMPPGFGFPGERHGSLSVDQQVELMNILETDGVGEINNFLGMDMSGISGVPSPDGNLRWN